MPCALVVHRQHRAFDRTFGIGVEEFLGTGLVLHLRGVAIRRQQGHAPKNPDVCAGPQVESKGHQEGENDGMSLSSAYDRQAEPAIATYARVNPRGADKLAGPP